MFPTLSTLLVLVFWLAAASCFIGSSRATFTFPAIPRTIEVPAGNKLHVVYYAVGLQYYTYNGSSWVLLKATADLYEHPKGKMMGKHFFLAHPDAKGGQPSWETLKSKSLVTAKLLEQVTVDPKSITWGLFEATSKSGSKALLGAVTYLQRIGAQGGLPPSSSEGAQKGDTRATPYSILYAYYTKQH